MPTRPCRSCLPLLGAAVLLAAAPAFSAEPSGPPGPPEPRNRLVAGTFTVVRYNPIGLDQQLSLTFRQRIGDSDDILYKTRFWSVGAMGAWNPANWSARVEAMFEPIAVFQLRAAYDTRGYAGSFGALLSSADPMQCITDACIGASTAADQDYAGMVQGLTLEPALQIAIGPLAVRNTFAVEYSAWSVVPATDTVVYDPGPDFLRPASGWTLTENATVGYLGDRFFAGALYQWINPLGLPGNAVQRVGLLGTFTFFDRGSAHGWFNKPTIIALALFNLAHRGRAGPVPTAIVAFTTESDLLPATPAAVPAP